MVEVSLSGRVAVVTGAGGGIGRAVAVALAQAGAQVVVNDVGGSLSGDGASATPAAETLRLIESAGGRGVISTESVATWAGAQAIVGTAIDSFGRIDIVVNNAGILRDAMFHKMQPEHWDAVIGVHLNGSFYVSRAAAEHFRAQESGAYVHMTSTAGLIGALGQANYAAAKAGIAALSRCIATDMKRYNVRSNCIAPFAWSRMVGSVPVDTPAMEARIGKLKQMTPDKIAPLAVYLASDAAEQVTGQVFGSRLHEIYLMSQSRPIRSVHRDGGWTPESIAEHAMPSMRASFLPLDRTQEVFSWDPI